MVKITDDGRTLMVNVEYSSSFVNRAKRLGGRWNPRTRTWDFVAEKKELVMKALLAVYGTDGESPPETVTVDIDMDNYGDVAQSFERFGRVLLNRPGRDQAVRIHSSVAVISGGFPPWGGSVRYPVIKEYSGTVLRVFNVPKPLAEKAVEDEGFTIVEEKVDYELLRVEREKLITRLNEIDTLLKQAV